MMFIAFWSIAAFFVATQVIYTIGLGISCIGFLMLIVALFIGATRRFLYALGTVFVIGGTYTFKKHARANSIVRSDVT